MRRLFGEILLNTNFQLLPILAIIFIKLNKISYSFSITSKTLLFPSIIL
jgi:hypothetical protein